mgnify:CR=1 FL=1
MNKLVTSKLSCHTAALEVLIIATDAYILIEQEDKSVQSIYCANEGDLNRLGLTLLLHYNTLSRVKDLLSLGNALFVRKYLSSSPLSSLLGNHTEHQNRDALAAMNWNIFQAGNNPYSKFAIRDSGQLSENNRRSTDASFEAFLLRVSSFSGTANYLYVYATQTNTWSYTQGLEAKRSPLLAYLD